LLLRFATSVRSLSRITGSWGKAEEMSSKTKGGDRRYRLL
jgi:hypothetical protein